MREARPLFNVVICCTIFAGLAGVAGQPNAFAQVGPTCIIEQLTTTSDQGSGFQHRPSINSDGSRICWTSFRDLVSQNADLSSELYLWRDGIGIEQLTDSGSYTAVQSFISADGSRIIFEGDADLVPGSNADGNFEEFYWDENAGFFQVTDTTVSALCGKSISGDGNRIFFGLSGEDVLGTNPDLNLEHYVYDVAAGVLTQITSSIGEGVCIGSPNNSGNTLFFSTNDVVGPPNPEGNDEVYRWREGAGIDAITSTTGGDSGRPMTSSNGRIAVFVSTADLLAGSNSDGNSEVFMWRASGGLFQLTDSIAGDALNSADISGNGERVAFFHSGNLTGGNPNLFRQLFVWEDNNTTQITNMPADESAWAIDLDYDGSHISFSSKGEPVAGGNPDAGWEVFLARCTVFQTAGAEVPALSPLAAAILVVLMAIWGMIMLRRAS